MGTTIAYVQKVDCKIEALGSSWVFSIRTHISGANTLKDQREIDLERR